MANIQKGTVFWITGLSGSGKSTIGKDLTDLLHNKELSAVFLDGDKLREITGNIYRHELEDRKRAAQFYSRLCLILSNQGINVICATISLFHEIQEWNRSNIENYIEIFLEVPLSTLVARDTKDIYDSKVSKHIVGIDIIAEFPKNPDLIIKNHGQIKSEHAAKQIFTYFLHKFARQKDKIHDSVKSY